MDLNRCWSLRQGPRIPPQATFAEELTAIEEFLTCFPEARQFWPWDKTPLAVSKQPEFETFLKQWRQYVEKLLQENLGSIEVFFSQISNIPEVFSDLTVGELIDLVQDLLEQGETAYFIDTEVGIEVQFRSLSPQICIGCGDV